MSGNELWRCLSFSCLVDASCRVLTRVCNNSQVVEAYGLSFLPAELVIDANLGWEFAHKFSN